MAQHPVKKKIHLGNRIFWLLTSGPGLSCARDRWSKALLLAPPIPL